MLLPKVLGIIGARAGSKRLPKKNVMELCGKPLICWSIEAALASNALTRLVVSTDCEEIATISKKAGAEIPYLRPEKLATDNASSVDFVLDIVKFYINKGEEFDYVMLLQPTSPLRSKCDVLNIVDLARSHSTFSFFVSVCECEHSPLWSTTICAEGSINGFIGANSTTHRSQDLESYYRLNGALYLADVKSLIKERAFYVKGNTKAYIMPKERSVDIDELFDFQFAKLLIENKKKENENK
ncbi:cytidylyltransferase domain-containing protein [Pseudoalteromonas sp. H105]|uniref:acylneuraminate cytidylyltransferase family protein n=1 Tax=Pseudoalteromonas sp. H105 TaxID=1348393 RepID=UPI0007322517|nr:acylneuraminate cytidylyltransferase family protein [Pseudoalteromonas sp. H105]KTF15208.1 hypothetical protein ATS75_10485 [Pseudoalteromonas sp. H105]